MLNANDESDDHEQCCALPALPLKPVKKITGTPAGAKMKVIEYAPRSWFLLTDGKQYYIDIDCTLSGTHFSLLLKLAKMEVYKYLTDGTRFLHAFAKTVQYSPTTYYNRNQSMPLQGDARVAIDEWHSRFIVPD